MKFYTHEHGYETTLCKDLHFLSDWDNFRVCGLYCGYKMDFKSYVKPNLPVQSGILRI